MFVKVCGVTNEDDALLAVAMGADAVGFVFAPSPRQVHPEVVRDILKRLPHDTLTIGVFRNETPERVIDITVIVVPTKAGTQFSVARNSDGWVPASAGTTVWVVMSVQDL